MSTATVRAISPATVESTAPSSSTNSIRIAIGRRSCRVTTSSMVSSARTSRSKASPTPGVRIGDRFRIGSALFEVTQPRVTCYRVGIRMNEPRAAGAPPTRTKAGPGFYFRVIEEGGVGAGDAIVKVSSGDERMSIERINALLCLSPHPREELRTMRCASRRSSPGWQSLVPCAPGGDRATRASLSGGRGFHGANPGFSPMRVVRIVSRERQTFTDRSFTQGDPGWPARSCASTPAARLAASSWCYASLPTGREHSLHLFHSYSLFRNTFGRSLSHRREDLKHGAGGAYLAGHVRENDVLDVGSLARHIRASSTRTGRGRWCW